MNVFINAAIAAVSAREADRLVAQAAISGNGSLRALTARARRANQAAQVANRRARMAQIAARAEAQAVVESTGNSARRLLAAAPAAAPAVASATRRAPGQGRTTGATAPLVPKVSGHAARRAIKAARSAANRAVEAARMADVNEVARVAAILFAGIEAPAKAALPEVAPVVTPAPSRPLRYTRRASSIPTAPTVGGAVVVTLKGETTMVAKRPMLDADGHLVRENEELVFISEEVDADLISLTGVIGNERLNLKYAYDAASGMSEVIELRRNGKFTAALPESFKASLTAAPEDEAAQERFVSDVVVRAYQALASAQTKRSEVQLMLPTEVAEMEDAQAMGAKVAVKRLASKVILVGKSHHEVVIAKVTQLTAGRPVFDTALNAVGAKGVEVAHTQGVIGLLSLAATQAIAKAAASAIAEFQEVTLERLGDMSLIAAAKGRFFYAESSRVNALLEYLGAPETRGGSVRAAIALKRTGSGLATYEYAIPAERLSDKLDGTILVSNGGLHGQGTATIEAMGRLYVVKGRVRSNAVFGRKVERCGHAGEGENKSVIPTSGRGSFQPNGFSKPSHSFLNQQQALFGLKDVASYFRKSTEAITSDVIGARQALLVSLGLGVEVIDNGLSNPFEALTRLRVPTVGFHVNGLGRSECGELMVPYAGPLTMPFLLTKPAARALAKSQGLRIDSRGAWIAALRRMDLVIYRDPATPEMGTSLIRAKFQGIVKFTGDNTSAEICVNAEDGRMKYLLAGDFDGDRLYVAAMPHADLHEVNVAELDKLDILKSSLMRGGAVVKVARDRDGYRLTKGLIEAQLVGGDIGKPVNRAARLALVGRLDEVCPLGPLQAAADNGAVVAEEILEAMRDGSIPATYRTILALEVQGTIGLAKHPVCLVTLDALTRCGTLSEQPKTVVFDSIRKVVKTKQVKDGAVVVAGNLARAKAFKQVVADFRALDPDTLGPIEAAMRDYALRFADILNRATVHARANVRNAAAMSVWLSAASEAQDRRDYRQAKGYVATHYPNLSADDAAIVRTAVLDTVDVMQTQAAASISAIITEASIANVTYAIAKDRKCVSSLTVASEMFRGVEIMTARFLSEGRISPLQAIALLPADVRKHIPAKAVQEGMNMAFDVMGVSAPSGC